LEVVRTPAEFEPQEAVWLIWPPTEEYRKGYSNSQVTLGIIDALLPETKVVLAVANAKLEAAARSSLSREAVENGSIEIVRIPSVDLWARDMGPTFVSTRDNGAAVVDFGFNTWGYSELDDAENIIEEKFDELVAEHLKLPLISSSMISEPGDHELNGKGTLMLVESVELQRNPSMSKSEIEREFGRLLGASNVVWLEQGLKDDEHAFLGPIEVGGGTKAYTALTTNGHVDEFARFVNPTTILLADVADEDLGEPVARENKRRLDKAFATLKAARDQDGKPFRILRIPLPKARVATMHPGDSVYDILSSLDYKTPFPVGKPIKVIAAASYNNFLITNKKIIAPKYWGKGLPDSMRLRDEQARNALKRAFPNREIVMLNAMALNLGGGGIHCITKQQPALAP